MSSQKMNPEVKAKWTAALRSGDYQQGRGGLLKDGKYCCLGVLCDIAVQEGVLAEPTVAGEDGWFFFDGAGSLPPLSVSEWAGLPSPSPMIGTAVPDRASEWNDSYAASFTEIADMIDTSL